MINNIDRRLFLTILTMTSSLMLAMNPSITTIKKFEPVISRPTRVISGTLLIHALREDDGQFLSPKFTDLNVQYCTKALRKGYVYPEFKNIPNNIPFVLMKIVPTNAQTCPKYTIIPVTELINLNNGSRFCCSSKEFTFDLTCNYNKDVMIGKEYSPKTDEKTIPVDFKTQFLMCMNRFYRGPAIHSNNLEITPELIENEIIDAKEYVHTSNYSDSFGNRGTMDYAYINYSHGVNGCSSADRLRDLAIKQTIKSHKTVFNYAMNRQQTGKFVQKLQPMDPAETKRLKDHYDHLERLYSSESPSVDEAKSID